MDDAIVIGGGPAGATAARLLARWGHRVTLVTRAPAQHHLAESLPPSCVHLFDRLGIRQAIEGAGFIRATGNTTWWAGQEMHVATFPGGSTGYQVPRGDLDALLLKEAERAGVEVHVGAVTTVEEGPDGRREVAWEEGGVRQTRAVPWVLDCTGRARLTTRAARGAARGGGSGARTTALAAVWKRASGTTWGVPDESHTLLESFNSGWAWSVPLPAGHRCLTVMLDPQHSAVAGGALLATYHASIALAPNLAARLKGAQLVEEPWACDATSYVVTTAAEPGVLRAGDAVSFADPLSSFGVKKAMASAWLAAVVVRTLLRHPERATMALAFHEARERQMQKPLGDSSRTFAREASAEGSSPFWLDRATALDASSGGSLSPEALRHDPGVRSAFDALRERADLALVPGGDVRPATGAAVVDDEIVAAEHLVAPGLEEPLRFLRGVNAVALAAMAPDYTAFPGLYEEYTRLHGPVPIGDVLSTLAVLVARGVLRFA